MNIQFDDFLAIPWEVKKHDWQEETSEGTSIYLHPETPGDFIGWSGHTVLAKDIGGTDLTLDVTWAAVPNRSGDIGLSVEHIKVSPPDATLVDEDQEPIPWEEEFEDFFFHGEGLDAVKENYKDEY